jgi:Mce-associated membrane protein
MTTTARRLLPGIAVAVVSAAALALLVWQATVWVQDLRDDGRRSAAVDVAKAQVLDLTTLDSASVAAQVAAMGNRVTGDFKRQFDGFSQTFADVVQHDQIKATGEIKAAAITSYDDNAAVVIVASSAQVSTQKQTTPTQRDYRISVSLERSGGSWLVSGMEFVR